MKATLFKIVFGTLLTAILLGCHGDSSTGVIVRGRVDDGTATSPLAGARCLYLNSSRRLLAQTTANPSGEFVIRVPPDVSGFVGCYPDQYPNLVLITYLGTMGAAEGETLPPEGLEEVSPRTTVVANIIAQTTPPGSASSQGRAAGPVGCGRARHDGLGRSGNGIIQSDARRAQITDEDFSDINGETVDDSPADAPDNGGVEGDAGDGSVFSPLVDATCAFDGSFLGDYALDDLFLNGTLELPNLQPIAAELGSDPSLPGAFRRYFPYGIQPLVGGQPLRTMTDGSGRYFLEVPPDTEGFVSCALQRDLSISTFIEPRPPGVILTDQNVLPPTELFTKLILPQLAEQDRQPTEANFFDDIGALGEINGPVQVDTILGSDGQLVVDTDGETCDLLVESAQAGGIQYVAAGAVSFYASALFKALLIETRGLPTATYGSILGNVLRRTDPATGLPNAVVLPQDLVAGGVPEDRATVLATALTACIQAGIVDLVGRALLIRMGLGRQIATASG